MFYYVIYEHGAGAGARNACICASKKLSDREAICIAQSQYPALFSGNDSDFDTFEVSRITRRDYSTWGYEPTKISMEIPDDVVVALRSRFQSEKFDGYDTEQYIIRLMELDMDDAKHDITRRMQVSSLHVSEKTWDLLQAGNLPVSVTKPHEDELTIWISDDYRNYLDQAKFPEDLWACICYAGDRHCQWLTLSEEGELVSDLETYARKEDSV